MMQAELNFREKVLGVVADIPKGGVLSYGEVAKLVGNLRAARAVGAIMRQNNDSRVPCHRVICSDGSLGGYNGILGEKMRVLKAEGVVCVRRGDKFFIKND